MKYLTFLMLICTLGCGTTSEPTDAAGPSDTATSAGTDTSSSGNLRWFETCGDPVCSGHVDNASVPPCTTEAAGTACSTAGATCDPINGCNAYLTCTDTDPKGGPAGCPRSSRALKTDIHYLTESEKVALAESLRQMPLATYRYTAAPEREHLGFVIEDVQPSVAVDPERNMVDLYGYLSLTVAAYQAQAAELDAVRRELAQVRAELQRLRAVEAR